MLFQAEHATGLERVEERLEHRVSEPGLGPVVNVAEGQHHVGRARRRGREQRGRENLGRHRLAVHVGPGSELGEEGLVPRLHEVRRGADAHGRARGIEVALITQHRRQHYGEPAGCGPDLDHGHVRLQAEKLERFLGMAIAIAGAVGVGTVIAGDGLIKQGIDIGGPDHRGGKGGGESEGAKQVLEHGGSPAVVLVAAETTSVIGSLPQWRFFC